eukprot:6173445-Pleurochrysis_carterae.AAC.2
MNSTKTRAVKRTLTASACGMNGHEELVSSWHICATEKLVLSADNMHCRSPAQPQLTQQGCSKR